MGRGEEDKARTAEGGACRDQAHLGPCRSGRVGLQGWEGRAPGVGGEGSRQLGGPDSGRVPAGLHKGRRGSLHQSEVLPQWKCKQPQISSWPLQCFLSTDSQF